MVQVHAEGFECILELPHQVAHPRADLQQARARFGGTGDFLFGTWCAVDIMYAPVVTRFITYRVAVPPFAELYMKAVLSHPHVHEWIDQAQDEPWVIEQYEDAAA